MDPATQALTIRPADWAALVGGVVEGLSYDLAAIACIGAVMAVLTAVFGRRGNAPETDSEEARPCPGWAAAVLRAPSPMAARDLRGVVPIMSGPYAVQLGRPRPCARRRVRRRAAVSRHLGPIPS